MFATKKHVTYYHGDELMAMRRKEPDENVSVFYSSTATMTLKLDYVRLAVG